MDNLGFIEIRITGLKGNFSLSPDNYDIRELIVLLENAEDLFRMGERRDRPSIHYKMEEGSVRHIFKTSLQYVIGFNAIIGQIGLVQGIDFLDVRTAKAFESIQEIASKKEYTFFIKTSVEQTAELRIDRTTHYYRTQSIWADAEFYFYGKLTNAGGKDKANIHISTEDYGTVRIQTPIRFLEDYNENLLYKNFGIRATGKQQIETGEIDPSTLKFLELVDYHPKYDLKYLEDLRGRAKKSWIQNINPDEWLREIRGGYDK